MKDEVERAADRQDKENSERSLYMALAEMIVATYPAYGSYIESIRDKVARPCREFTEAIRGFESMDSTKSLDENISMLGKKRGRGPACALEALRWAIINREHILEQKERQDRSLGRRYKY